MTETVLRHEIPSGHGGTVYRYTLQVDRPDGWFSSAPATFVDWAAAELERLAVLRADGWEPEYDEDGTLLPGPFEDALDLAETLFALQKDAL